jgi:hypothetical protein
MIYKGESPTAAQGYRHLRYAVDGHGLRARRRLCRRGRSGESFPMPRIAIMASLCLLSGNAQSGNPELTTGMAQTTICGTLHRGTFWGPPGFGENPKTDSTFTVWLLSLREPIIVNFGQDTGEDSERKEVSEIQLIVPTTRALHKNLEQLNRALIVASGRLWTGTAPGEVTPVILQVLDPRTIKAARGGTACRVRQSGSQ